MANRRYIRVHITVSSNQEFPIEELFVGAEDATDDEIDEWLDENAWYMVEEDDWATIDVDTRVFDREVDDEDE